MVHWLLKHLYAGVLLCGHQNTFGKEVKIKVKPGDNVTVFGDCVVPVGSHIFWIRNNSYGNQSISLFAEDLFQGTFPRFHFVANSSSNSFDLHIKNASFYDEGLYYCATVERKITDVNDKVNIKLEYQYGNRRTHLSILGKKVFNFQSFIKLINKETTYQII